MYKRQGVNFTEFTSVCVQEENGEIAVYVGDNLVCTITMSEPDEVTTHWNENYWDTSLAGMELFSGDSYRKVEIKDAEGAVVATVDEAVVPVTGLFAFINRANNFGLDNLAVYELSLIHIFKKQNRRDAFLKEQAAAQ